MALRGDLDNWEMSDESLNDIMALIVRDYDHVLPSLADLEEVQVPADHISQSSDGTFVHQNLVTMLRPAREEEPAPLSTEDDELLNDIMEVIKNDLDQNLVTKLQPPKETVTIDHEILLQNSERQYFVVEQNVVTMPNNEPITSTASIVSMSQKQFPFVERNVAACTLQKTTEDTTIPVVDAILLPERVHVEQNISNMFRSAAELTPTEVVPILPGKTLMEQKILSVLQSSRKPLSSNDIARSLGFNRIKELNHVIYGLERMGLLKNIQTAPPLWIRSNNTTPTHDDLANVYDRIPLPPKQSELTGLTSLEQIRLQNTFNLHTLLNAHTHDLPVNMCGQVSTIEDWSGEGSMDPLASASLNDASISGVTPLTATGCLFNKNPLNAFNEFGQKCNQRANVTVSKTSGASHNPIFHAKAFLNKKVVAEAFAGNKKGARRLAAATALKLFTNQRIESKQKPIENYDSMFSTCIQ